MFNMCIEDIAPVKLKNFFDLAPVVIRTRNFPYLLLTVEALNITPIYVIFIERNTMIEIRITAFNYYLPF